MRELYFCLHLSENEHRLTEQDVKEMCRLLGLEFIYYRQLKEGHIPMYREVRLKGTRTRLGKFKTWMCSEQAMLEKFVRKNPYKLSS